MDERYFHKNLAFLAGVDEVGRGPLAGPVVACCVKATSFDQYPKYLRAMGVTDSKKLTLIKRHQILEELKIQKGSLQGKLPWGLSFFVSVIDANIIDQINILQASLLAMRKAYEGTQAKGKGLLLIDGNKLIPELRVPMEAIIKGDSKVLLIGLASIIAKVYRDQLMRELADRYPGYGLEQHAGYPTVFHREAIAHLGPSPIHRRSFKGVKEFLQELP